MAATSVHDDGQDSGRGLSNDLSVGLGLVALTLGRGILAAPLDPLSIGSVAVAATALGSILVRQRWPFLALALACVSGVVAMTVDLRASTADALVGLGLLSALLMGLLLGRRARPHVPSARDLVDILAGRWMLLVGVGATLGWILIVPVDLKESAAIALLLAAHAVGSSVDRRTTVVAAIAALAVLVVGGSVFASAPWSEASTPIPLIAAALVGAAAGDSVRSRRELLAALDERARRVEQALEEASHRRVVEERLRIARDVHDLVAHHIAVVNVQAGVAAHALKDPPGSDGRIAALEAIGHVRSASKTVLDELGTLLSVLRGPRDAAQLTQPTPNLGDLERLLESFGAGGLDVEFELSGQRRPIPSTIELSAYRIIEESLTNARKHGSGRIQLRLAYRPDSVAIDVSNDRRPDVDSTDRRESGYGLIGMKERAKAVHGTFEAGPSLGQRYVVRATLPLSNLEGKDDLH